jgi:hypothetical protein
MLSTGDVESHVRDYRKRLLPLCMSELVKPPTRPGPEKISVAKLPVTGTNLFGREEDITFLERAWANKDVNVVT